MMFNWFKSEHRKRRKLIRSDREHLEVRARRFLKGYLNVEETGKPQYYRAVDEISRKCQPPEGLSQTDMNDIEIAEAASLTAFQIVLNLEKRSAKGETVNEFITDACATVAVAYHRAAGVYIADEKMQKLGTAAVHLLTMATSYMRNEYPADKHGV